MFITATDRGVGKTFVACGLIKFLKDKGFDVAYYKPLSCGGDISEDIDTISRSAKCPVYGTYHFKTPISPYAAAKIQEPRCKIQKISQDYKKIKKKHDIVIVEGIGGVLVPVTHDIFIVDLIKILNIPAIIVARAGLGTINHTLLTIEALKKRKAKILGVIYNKYKGKDPSESTNPQIITKFSGVPVLSKIRNGENNYDFGAILNFFKYTPPLPS